MPHRPGLAVTAALAIALAAGPSAPLPGPTSPTAAAAGGTTRYVPVQPCRLADTRAGAGIRPVDPNRIRVAATGCGLPDEATAVVVSVTVVNAPGTGFLVAYPGGGTTPAAATLNWRAGNTRGNTATVPLGDGGSIELFRPDGFDRGAVTVDVTGAFVPADTATSGRFVGEPAGRRLLDTRDGGRKLRPGESIDVAIPDGIPDDATALAVTITAVETSGRGYFTVHPTATERPTASVLNVDGAGGFRSASTIAPIDAGGFRLYSSGGAHVVVDATGWFTGESADDSTAGLFVPVTPLRLADTRPEPKPIHPGGTIGVALPAGLTDGVQAGAPAALAVSMTMVDPDRQGYITAHPARTRRGEIASGYALAGEIAAQFALVPASAAGIAVYAANGTELTADLTGWFTGAATPITEGAPENPVPPQRVLAIGDSTMAGVDRTNANRALQGAIFDFRARSCRRLIRESCRGREGPVPPPTAYETLSSVPEDAYDVLIVWTGYNDTMPGFASDVPQMVALARAKGIRRIIWPTMAREFRFDKGGADAFQVYEQHSQVIRANAAAHDFMIAPEWSSIVRQVPWWTYSDGIHLDRPGGYGAADLMSRAVAHVTGQPCPQPEFPGGPTLGICPEPGSRPPVDVRSLYGF